MCVRRIVSQGLICPIGLACPRLSDYPSQAAKVNKRTLKLAAKIALLWSEGVIGPVDV